MEYGGTGVGNGGAAGGRFEAKYTSAGARHTSYSCAGVFGLKGVQLFGNDRVGKAGAIRFNASAFEWVTIEAVSSRVHGVCRVPARLHAVLSETKGDSSVVSSVLAKQRL